RDPVQPDQAGPALLGQQVGATLLTPLLFVLLEGHLLGAHRVLLLEVENATFAACRQRQRGGKQDCAGSERAHAQRPRRNHRSISARPNRVQVGRPWLHWSDRSVASMSRSRAFISGIVSRRFARTAPWQAMVESSSSRAPATRREAPCSSRSASTSRSSASTSPWASRVGTARSVTACGPARVTSKPSSASVADS